MSEFGQLPDGLPVPLDDGSADHLAGTVVPSLRLLDASGTPVDLVELAAKLLVLFIYPRTGTPGEPLPAGWDEIPGARGCTPQSCAYRDRVDEFTELGAAVAGLSAQPMAEQAAFAQREHIPYPLLNDTALELGRALRLPTFEAAGMVLYRRLTIVAERGLIERAFYPVFPPDQNAETVLAWLHARI